jgi:hypothetical protein
MQRPNLLSAAVLVAVATAGCQPEVLIASSEPEASGSSSGGVAGTGTSGTGGSSVGGTLELPSAGEGGVVSTPEPPRLLADSVADFSLTQGERGWWYGYDGGSLDTFTLLTRKSVITNYVPASNDVWDCWANDTAHWTQIFQLGAHANGIETSTPSNAVLQRAVRRWVSTFAGDVTIAGEVAKIDLDAGGGSNGVDTLVYVDGTERYSTFIGGADGGGRAYKFVAALQVGSTVDFVLDPHESDDRHDLSRFTGIVVRVETGPAQ